MSIGMLLNLISVQNIASAYKNIQGALSAGPDEISWVLSSFLIAEVIMLPLSGWLMRALSTKVFFTICALGFSFMSVLCGFAWNIESMIIFRVFQGFFGGGMMPAMFVVLFTLYPKEEQETITIVVGFIATLASALGPPMGGYLSEIISWRWVFMATCFPGLLVGAFVWTYGNFDKADKKLLKKIDFPGIILASITLGCGLWVLEEGRRADWFDSIYISSASAIAFITLIFFLIRSYTAKDSIVDLRVFSNRNFFIASILVFTWCIVLFAPAYLLPIFLAQIRGFDSQTIGMMVFVIGFCQFLSGFIAWIFLKIMTRRAVACIGFILLAIGTWLQGHLFSGVGLEEIMIPQIVRGLAAQLCFLPILNLSIGYLPESSIKNASGLFSLMMRLGAAIGIAASNTLVYSRTQVHYLSMSESVSSASKAFYDFSKNSSAVISGISADSPQGIMAKTIILSEIAYRESAVIAFNEVTLWIAVFMFLLIPITLFFIPISKKKIS